MYGKNSGICTSSIVAAYPVNLGTLGPVVCDITAGTYTIDPNTGGITSSAMLGGASCFFSLKDLSEVGYLSDPSAKKLYLVQTGQGGGDIIHYIRTEADSGKD